MEDPDQQKQVLIGLFTVLLIGGIAAAAVFLPASSFSSSFFPSSPAQLPSLFSSSSAHALSSSRSPASPAASDITSNSVTGFVEGGGIQADFQAQKRDTQLATNSPRDGDSIVSGTPTFTGVLITAYYIPDRNEFPSTAWCGSSRTCRPNLGGAEACELSQKGPYEAGKCNGQLKIGDKFYAASALKTTEADTLSQAGNVPHTATGTVPTKKKTIAVNSQKGSPCYIPYHSKVYIKFSDANNPWTGWYDAEDTGSLITSCHIDVFAGYGASELNDAKKSISGQQAQVWVCDPGNPGSGDACKNINTDLQMSIGTYEMRPAFRASYPYDLSAYDSLKEWAGMVIADCTDNTPACVQKHVDDYNAQQNAQQPAQTPRAPLLYGKTVAACDAEGNPSFTQFAEDLMDCMDNNQSDCLCEVNLTQESQAGSFRYTLKTSFSQISQFTFSTLSLEETSKSKTAPTFLKEYLLPADFFTYRALDGVNKDYWTGPDATLTYDVTLSGSPTGISSGTGTIDLPGIADGQNGKSYFASDVPTQGSGQGGSGVPPLLARYGSGSMKSLLSITTLRFYKEDVQNISLVHTSYDQKPLCTPRKVDFRFCSIPAYPLVSSTPARASPILFSLTLRDNPPAPVDHIEAVYYKDTGSLRVAFPPSLLPSSSSPSSSSSLTPDISAYLIYCSREDFSSGAKPSMLPTRIYNPATTASPQDTQSVEIKACGETGSATAIIPNLDAPSFYVMVVVLDKTGQVSSENPYLKADVKEKHQ